MASKHDILSVLQDVQSGALTPEDALLHLKLAPFEDLGYAKVDYHRAVRQGVPEVIYGQSKTKAAYWPPWRNGEAAIFW